MLTLGSIVRHFWTKLLKSSDHRDGSLRPLGGLFFIMNMARSGCTFEKGGSPSALEYRAIPFQLQWCLRTKCRFFCYNYFWKWFQGTSSKAYLSLCFCQLKYSSSLLTPQSQPVSRILSCVKEYYRLWYLYVFFCFYEDIQEL